MALTNGHGRVSTPAPGSPANLRGSGPCTWYVDQAKGDDVQHDGTAARHMPTTVNGPKRTVAAALAHASRGDTIIVATGVYPENVCLDGLHLIPSGHVIFK